MTNEAGSKILDSEGRTLADVAKELLRPAMSAKRMIDIVEREVAELEARGAELQLSVDGGAGDPEIRNLAYVKISLSNEQDIRDERVKVETVRMMTSYWLATEYFKANLESFKAMAEEVASIGVERRQPRYTTDRGEIIHGWDVLKRPCEEQDLVAVETE